MENPSYNQEQWKEIYVNYVSSVSETVGSETIIFIAVLSFFSIWGVFLFVLLPSNRKYLGVLSLLIALSGAGYRLITIRLESTQPVRVFELEFQQILQKEKEGVFCLTESLSDFVLTTDGLMLLSQQKQSKPVLIANKAWEKIDSKRSFFVIYSKENSLLFFVQDYNVIW